MQAFTGRSMNGVLTYILIDNVKKNEKLTYADLLDKIQDAIDQFSTNDHCLIGSKFLQKFFTNRITQVSILP